MSDLLDEEEQAEGGTERWLVSYADFITLMFAFFTVLYATSQQDHKKTKEFQESIKRYLIKTSGGGAPSSKALPGDKGETPIEDPIPVFKQASKEAVAELDSISRALEAQVTPAERKKFLIDLATDDLGVRISLAAESIFSPQSEKFDPAAIRFINKISAVIAGSKRRIMIEAYVPKNQKGNYSNSWEFASARAVNYLRFLQQRHKVDPDRLSAMSHGDSQAQVTKSDYNNRLEIVLIHDDLDF